MNNIDDKIREALQQEDSQMLKHLQSEPSLREMVIETFRSRHRWVFVTAFFMPFVFLILVGIFGYQFFHAESMRAMIGWATGVLWSLIATGMFKLMYMMELNKNSVTREIKRLELRLIQMSQQHSEE